METGFPDRFAFDIFVEYTARFKDSITYYQNWTVEKISFEDQIFTMDCIIAANKDLGSDGILEAMKMSEVQRMAIQPGTVAQRDSPL